MASSHTDGGVTLKVAHIGHTAYGRARYRVIVRDSLQDRIVFVSEALELPWVDDRRALRDAVGFLAYYLDGYVLDGTEPEAGSGVSGAELAELAPYADTLAYIAAELES